jgi:hypothetical protein
MTRNDFRKLARIRLKETRALLLNGHYAGAYYLGGYVIECGLKACIAKKTRRHEFPPEKKVVEDIYTHELPKLLRAAGLRESLEKSMQKDRILEVNWNEALKWSEKSRYHVRSQSEARELYSAIVNKQHGVLRWIRQHW